MKNSNRLMLLGGVVGMMLTAVPPLFADTGRWSDADSNKDGSIDRTEFDAQRAGHFQALDANGDTFISADEMKAFHDQQRAEKNAARADMGAKILMRADTSGDGKISAAEWQANSLKKFVKLDDNNDGAVTTDEMQKTHKRGDGKSGDATQADGKSRGDFKGGLARLDTDKDGKVSAAEWNVVGDKMFARLDDNKDGKIGTDELPRHRKDDKPQP